MSLCVAASQFCRFIVYVPRLGVSTAREEKKKEEKTSPKMPSLQIYEMKAPGEYAAFLFWEILSSR